MKLSRTSALLLVGLVCFAYALRVIGTASSVIYAHDPQLVRQSMALGQALLRSSDVSTGFEGGFKYPLTLTAYLTAVYGAFFVAGSAFGVFEHAKAFQDYLFANREAIYLLAVLALNIISVLLIPAIFLAQRALNPRHRGWIAAGLAATNLLLLHCAHQPRPHVPFATLAFCATVLLVMAAHRIGGGWILLAACSSSRLSWLPSACAPIRLASIAGAS